VSSLLQILIAAYQLWRLIKEDRDVEERSDVARKLSFALNYSRETGDTGLLELAIKEHFKRDKGK